MPNREVIIQALRDVGMLEDAEIDVAGTALLLGALDRPDADLAPYREHLAQLAAAVRAAADCSDSVEMQAEALRRVLAEQYGYQGDRENYEDLRNASLPQVIDRRLGLPVALGILYLHAGRSYGADISGLSFPSHFLIRLTARTQRLILDPFHGGQTMGTEDLRQRLKQLLGSDQEIRPAHYRAVSNRDILIRLLNNIKIRVFAAGDLRRVAQVLEAMTLIAPSRAELWWEAAVIQARLGDLKTAIATLERYLSGSGDVAGRDELAGLLSRLRGHLN